MRIDTIVVSTQHDEFIGPKGISQKEADEAAKVTFSNTEAVQIRSQKYTYSQMKKDMQELAQQYSDSVR